MEETVGRDPKTLTSDEVRQIRYRVRHLRQGVEEIATKFGITAAQVRSIAANRSRKDVREPREAKDG